MVARRHRIVECPLVLTQVTVRIRPGSPISCANVTSTLAVFLALGGSDSYSFSLGPFDGGSATASFGTNQVRLFCSEGTCSAQVEASGEGAILGVDESGELNEPPTVTKMIFGETPGIVTVAAISSSPKAGEKLEGEGRVTLWLRNDSGWQIDLHILTEPGGGGNIRLLGTAIPTTIDECAGVMGTTICPSLNFT